MIINVKLHGGIVVAQVDARTIDASNASKFKSDMLCTMTNECDGIVLNLESVEFVDSAGLGAIVGVYKQFGSSGPFKITGLTSGVARVFRLTRMDRVFDIRASVDEALRDVVAA